MNQVHQASGVAVPVLQTLVGKDANGRKSKESPMAHLVEFFL